MLVMGIDPGIAITGYGLIEQSDSGDLIVIDYGVFRTDSHLTLSSRLLLIYNHITDLLLLHKPQKCAVEKLFFQKNVKTAMAVGEARGVVLLALEKQGINPKEYTPNEVKQAVAGYGGADKKQIQMMVQTLLALPELPKPDDAADALAIALCYISQIGYDDAISASVRQ